MKALFFLLVGMVLISSTAFGYIIRTNSNNKEIKWGTKDVSYYVQNSDSKSFNVSTIESETKKAFDTWSSIPGSYMKFKYAGTTADTTVGYDYQNPAQNKNIVYFEKETWEYEETYLAVTLTVYNMDTNEILDADVVINEVNFSWANTGEINKIDFQNTLTHELGHSLGLAHSDIESATMWSTSYFGDLEKRTLDTDDMKAVVYQYPDAKADQAVASYDLQETESYEPQVVGCSQSGLNGLSDMSLFFFIALFVFSYLLVRRNPVKKGVVFSRANRFFALIAVFFVSQMVSASAAMDMDFYELSEKAQKVVTGKVLKLESYWDKKIIYTRVELEIQECLKGDCDGKGIITIERLGGEIGKIGMNVEGVETYKKGEDVLLFLRKQANWNHHRVIGWSIGKYSIINKEGKRYLVRNVKKINFLKRKLEDVLPFDTTMKQLKKIIKEIKK